MSGNLMTGLEGELVEFHPFEWDGWVKIPKKDGFRLVRVAAATQKNEDGKNLFGLNLFWVEDLETKRREEALAVAEAEDWLDEHDAETGLERWPW